MKSKTVFAKILAAVIVLMLVVSCHNFYKVISQKKINPQKGVAIDSLALQNRYFVLRSGNNSLNMHNIKLSADHKTLTCTLDTLSILHQLHLKNGYKGRLQYHKGKEEEYSVLNEVHIYIPDDNSARTGEYKLDLDKIQKLEVIEHDQGRTTGSYILGAFGYTLGAIALVGIIVAATKSSCPFVSAYTENNFLLQGEIYGGAIYPQLARHDYMPLKMSPLADKTLQIKISNELKETQFTDMADLWVITHDKNAKVLSDDNGNLYSINHPQTATKAVFNNGDDVTDVLATDADNRLLHFDDTATASAENKVELHFNKPATAAKSKLILSLKNSYFLDYLYGDLAKGFGKYYNTYAAQQRKKPAAALIKWTQDQHIPLEVSLKTKSGWKKIASVNTIGPLATREIVIPVDLSAVTEKEAQVRLSSGFMFWEIDYAAIDYSADDQFKIEKLTPVKATDENNKDVLSLLQKEDGQYLAQPQIGNVVTLVYQPVTTATEAQSQSYILHSRGYYEHLRSFTGKPDRAFLNQFKQPGAFALYGMQQYKKLKEANLQSMTANK